MKFKSLEALRGIAAVIVVMFHSRFFYGGINDFIGNGALFVDFFFMLSGFIMAIAYQDKIGNVINFKTYFLRRFGRLYPLHLFMLFVWIPYILFKIYVYKSGIGGSNPLDTSNVSSFIANLFMIHSLGLFSYESWNFPSWSISVEFYTYIVFFVFVLFTGNRKKILYPLALSFICYLILVYLFPHGHFLKTYDYGLIRCMAGFFAGVTLYILYSKKKFVLNNFHIVTLIELFIAYMVYYTISCADLSSLNKIYALVCFALAIYFFASQESGFVSKLLNKKPMQLLGKLSYSIYMVHALIVVMVQNIFIYIFKYHVESFHLKEGPDVLGVNTQWAYLIDIVEIIIVVAVSYLTYKYIEEPWRKKFRRMAEKKEFTGNPVNLN